MQPRIGWIGQGWIGKNYADDFEERGYEVVRYGLEPEFLGNRARIAICEIVFIAVPTPTRPDAGFDASIVDEALALVGAGTIAVIKSTVLPGTTELLQQKHPDIFLMHAPEFLVAKTAAQDARNPLRNILGVTSISASRADEVMHVLPPAPYQRVMKSGEAEMVKYAGNGWLTFKVLFMNLVYDACVQQDIAYDVVKEAVGMDPRIGTSHMDVIHEGGRGAGSYCFIKDLAALRELVARNPEAGVGLQFLQMAEEYNQFLLYSTGKSLEQLAAVYGAQAKTP